MILFIISFVPGLSVWTQDLHFSQLENTPLFLSPAQAAATAADFRASIHHRNQWASIGSPFTTYGIAMDGKLKKKDWRNKHFGAGLVIYNDKAGDLNFNRFQADLQVAYHQKLNDNNYLSGGIQVGIVRHSIDMSSGQWDNQYDGLGYNASLPSGELNLYQPFSSFDAGAGILWTYGAKSSTLSSQNLTNFQIGFSANHLSKPKLSFYNVPGEDYFMRFVLHGNGIFGINNSSWAVKPAAIYQRKGKEQEFVLGVMFRYLIKEKSKYTGFVNQMDFSLGAYYRAWSDAIIPTLYYNFANFGVGLSYDINVSKLATASKFRGGFEFSLKFVTPNPMKPSNSSFPSM